MLACLGPVVFDVVNDLSSIDMETSSSFAKHDVVKASPIYENTGDEESQITLKGTLHPQFAAGALVGISALELARQQKIPLPLLRGDFTPFGWVLISSISQSHEELDPMTGVGSVVTYSIKLLRVSAPSSEFIPTLVSLFR